VICTQLCRGKRHASDGVTQRLEIVGCFVDRFLGDVFGGHASRSDICHDPEEVRPEIVRHRSSSRCTAELLAWKPSNHDVSASSVGSTVEMVDVAEDGEDRERSVTLPSEQDLLSVGRAFDGTDASMPKQMSGEDSAASSCEKMKLIHLLPFIARLHPTWHRGLEHIVLQGLFSHAMKRKIMWPPGTEFRRC
jgi:hypothetical protein